MRLGCEEEEENEEGGDVSVGGRHDGSLAKERDRERDRSEK